MLRPCPGAAGGDCLLSHPQNLPAEQAPLPRSLFGYDVLDRLGEGAASVIYLVSAPRTSQVYALKHVVRKTDKDDRFIQQLENEFEVSKLFKHPALRRSVDLKFNRTFLRRVIDAGLVMEMIDGVPLDQQMPRDLRQALDYFIQAARALAALHYLGYVHCDFKPHNIMVMDAGLVKLVDFGQTARVGTAKPRVQGTPDFIAPEQVKCKPVSEQTDVYSFGASLYWVITGQRVPTLFTTRKDQRDLLTDQKYPSPRDLRPDTPIDLSNLVMDCMRMNPLRRPGTMNEVQLRLESVLRAMPQP